MSKRRQFKGDKANATPYDRLIEEFMHCFRLSDSKNMYDQFAGANREEAGRLVGSSTPSLYTGHGHWPNPGNNIPEGFITTVLRAVNARSIAWNRYQNGRLIAKSFLGFTWYVKK